ncbi:MAG TPA: quinone oxidoreductase [Dehalococcoidia bacterium]|nr:quinone oxidoreductase [Dehalococcoidia bacterium]
MQAVFVTDFGGPEVLKLMEAAMPTPGPGEVLIKVAASTVNFADIDRRRNAARAQTKPPFVPGLEAAGTIEAIGPGVSGLAVGQRVTAHTDGGSYTEYALARAIGVFPISDALDWSTAACVPSVGTTSLNLLTYAGRLQPGETVLIHAAAGGVGTTAVQLARHLGASKIIGTVGSEEKASLIKSLGADVAINYREEDVPARVREITDGKGVNLVLDSVGKDTFLGSIASLGTHGRLVCYGQASGPPPAIEFGSIYGENKTIVGYSTGGFRRTRPEALRAPGLAALELLNAGRWKPVIGASYSLDAAAEAQTHVESRASTGKVILLT